MSDPSSIQRLRDAMRRVADTILTQVDPDTGLCLTGPFDGVTGEPIRIECNPEDFGDFLPFLFSAGTILGESRYTEFVLRQFQLAEDKLREDKKFYRMYRKGKSMGSRPILAQDQADALLGLNLMYVLTDRPEFAASAEALCRGLVEEAQTDAGYLLDVIRPRRPWDRFLKLVKPTVNGTLAEEMLNLSHAARKEDLQTAALRILHYWAYRWEFQDNGFLPDGMIPYLEYPVKKFGRFMKTNSNFLHACLTAYRVTLNGEWLRHTEYGVQSWLDLRWPDGTIPKIVHSRTGEVLVPTRELTQHFTLIDLLLDIDHLETGTFFLEEAVKVAEPWLALESGLGLIPEGMLEGEVEVELSFRGLPKAGKLSWRATKLDQMSDMGVSLLKLAEKTKDAGLKHRAVNSILALSKTHATEKSFVAAVDHENGTILRSTNLPKYLGGYLKGLLAAHAALTEKSLFDEAIWFLLRDR